MLAILFESVTNHNVCLPIILASVWKTDGLAKTGGRESVDRTRTNRWPAKTELVLLTDSFCIYRWLRGETRTARKAGTVRAALNLPAVGEFEGRRK